LAWMGSVAEDDIEESAEPIQILRQLAITNKITVLALGMMLKWAEELIEYLEKGILPTD
jgi:hypothetical protein